MARDSSLYKNDSPVGGYTRGSPGYAGQLKCQAEIWRNLPIAIRRQQDQAFIFSPETIQIAPANIREKLQGIDNLDGLFLAFQPKYQHNFICAKKRPEEAVGVLSPDQEEERNLKAKIQNNTGIIPLSDLEFYDEIRESLLGDPGNRILTLDGSTATSAQARAAHHMWINDGSLYSDYVVLPSEVNASPSDDEEPEIAVRKRTSAKWAHRLINASINENQDNETARTSVPDFHAPRQTANSLVNPVTLIDELSLNDVFRDSNENVYRGINPGIHWRVEKRTPLFQGEDFWVEFHRDAISADIPNLGNAKFRMRNKFSHLDINSIPEGATGCNTQTLALIELDADGAVVEESKSTFDFSKQTYYVIEIGIGSYGKTDSEGSRTSNGNDSDQSAVGHNYYIILAENAAPIFCHYDRIYLPCGVDEGDGDFGSGNGPKRTTELSENPILRRLSTYQGVRSKVLMEQDNLRVTVRQHLGRIVVTFSGYEDVPWIIERNDLTPRPDNDTSEDSQSEIEFISETVPMLIPKGRMAIMAGNRKTSFSFSPMTYIDVVDLQMPQPLSILGPLSSGEESETSRDINLLLREKGVSRLLNVNTSDNKRRDAERPRKLSNRNFQFNQDAEVYRETINGQVQDTNAMEVQPDLVRARGKAPALQRSTDYRGRPKSTIGITYRNGIQRLGSDARYAYSVQPTAQFRAGTYVFEAIPGDDADNSDNIDPVTQIPIAGDPWWLSNCITPIMTGFSLYVPSDDEPAFRKQIIDVSHHILNFSENWSADGWQNSTINKIDHTADITFLINAGMKFENDLDNYASYIHSLADKAFYIRVSLWWEGGIMPLPARNIDRVVFTGVCYGGEVDYQNNQRIMKCRLNDYTSILEHQKFKNSPFFDKMRDFNAVYEILQLASFRDGAGDNDSGTRDQTQPASLLRRLADYDDGNDWISLVHNGETLFNREYALPGSYDILQDPFLRFQDGETYYQAIEQMAQLSGKVFYFDRLGVFHYDALPYEQELFGYQQSGGNGDELNQFDWDRLSKVDFIASPRENNEPELYRQVFNAYTITRKVEDVNNEIRVISTTPDGKLLVAGHTNFDSLFDPDKPGFLGYPKEFLQADGIFGDEASVKWYVKNLTKMFLPPVVIKFTAVGRNLMRPLDIVTFRGLGMTEPQRLIIAEINSSVEPGKGEWMQEYTCYWLYPSTNIEWGETNNTTISLEGTVEDNNNGNP